MQKDFKKKLWINLGISLAIILFLLIVSYLATSDIESRTKEIQGLKKEIAFRAKAIESLAVLKDESRRAQSYFSLLQNILPTKDQLLSFRKDMTSLAGGLGMDLGFVFGSDSPGTEDKPGFVNFKISVSGETKNFIPFLEKVEKSSYFVSFDSIEFNREKDRFNSNMSGRVYSR